MNTETQSIKNITNEEFFNLSKNVKHAWKVLTTYESDYGDTFHYIKNPATELDHIYFMEGIRERELVGEYDYIEQCEAIMIHAIEEDSDGYNYQGKWHMGWNAEDTQKSMKKHIKNSRGRIYRNVQKSFDKCREIDMLRNLQVIFDSIEVEN